MNIEPKHVLSPISNDESFVSTFENLPPDVFSFESTPIANAHPKECSTLLDDQLRLERHIANQSSILTQQSFTTTYSGLHTMFAQMQMKLSSIFLQETEYLKEREDDLENSEKNLAQRQQQIQQVENERRQLENEFTDLQNRLNQAVDYISHFYTDGERILQILFSESRQIDADLSALISECLGSLTRCRTMIDEKINNFSQQSARMRTNLIDRQAQIRHTQLTITLMLDLVNQLNEQNVEHSNELTLALRQLEKKCQDAQNQSETTKMYWNIQQELNEILKLEKQKQQLKQELFDQTLMLENINTVIGKAIIN